LSALGCIFSVKGQDNTFTHTVESGQTVYAIATMYGTTPEQIYKLNPQSKEKIKAGEKLLIPQTAESKIVASTKNTYFFHTIEPKETLYSLSIKYGVTASEIIDANPGLSISTFNIGKIIRIPASAEKAKPTQQKVKKETVKYSDYKVGKKETFYHICRKFGVTTEQLVAANPQLKNGLKAGETIKIPEVVVEETTVSTTHRESESEANSLLANVKQSTPVDMVKVSLLLPFMIGEKPQSQASARFVEYYEGLLLAIDSLRNIGNSVELNVYDTGNGTKKVKEILSKPELKNSNLIIGAVQNDQIAVVAAFAEKNKIKYVIPFTSKNDDVLSNAFVYQVNTPHSYLYAKAAEAGYSLFSKDNIIILNMPEETGKKEFIKTFETELDDKHVSYKELTYNAEMFAEQLEGLLADGKKNVIVPSSGALSALNKICAPIRMIMENRPEIRISLFGYPEWQTYAKEHLDDFYAMDTYIYTNFYADNLSGEVSDFYNRYKKWYSKPLINTYPKYGILGFDTGMFFIGSISKYGTQFENSLGRINYKSLQTGFDFNRVNNWGGFINTNIFIVHYQKDFKITRKAVK
jgi:LysM repeat protein